MNPQEVSKTNQWFVIRLDDNSNEYLFGTYHSEQEAKRAAQRENDKGHKQTFFVTQNKPEY